MDINSGNSYPKQSYALSGKIMLSSIIILFAVIIVVVCFHLYARWYLLRARRQLLLRRNLRRANLDVVTVPATRGLDPSLLESLHVFNYSPETHEVLLECAVCLSEFETGEKGRTLPKCNHSFHIDCIDMWFTSHSTCPLCRSPVEPEGTGDLSPVEAIVTVDEPVETEHAGSSSGLCSSCTHDKSSFWQRRKQVMGGVSIEVPRRSGDELRINSPASSSFKSPGNRIRSLKRILSRGLSPSGGAGTSSGSLIYLPTDPDSDLERGRDELIHRNRVDTPRPR